MRATSHTRLRAHDPYTSSTLIGGKRGAGPSSLRLRNSRSKLCESMIRENRQLVTNEPIEFEK